MLRLLSPLLALGLTTAIAPQGATALPTAQATQGVPADTPPAFFPRGVYLSWELTYHCAAYCGIAPWEDVRRRLDACVANHVNTIWVANLPEKALPKLIRECERRDLKLLASLGSIEGKS